MSPELRGMLILTSIEWAGACLCYALARYGRTWGLVLAWVLGCFAFLVSLIAPTTLLQFLVLFAIALPCVYGKQQSVARFALLSIVGSVLAIAVVDMYAQMVWGAIAREFPLESLAHRLAYEAAERSFPSPDQASETTSPVSLIAARQSAGDLQKLDELYHGDYIRGRGSASLRRRSLELAHASQLAKFENIEDAFGARRMPAPSPRFAERIDSPPVRLPDVKLVCTDAELSALPMRLIVPPIAWTEPYHAKAVVNFANLDGWGYVQDRQHVAGYESHRFDEVPVGPDPQWQTIRVELVSLLKHDEPGVYVSEYLPAMDELRDAPVRPLDAFEARSLALLAQGGDIEADAIGHQIRMLGAIRAADKCLQCHTVEHGTLLGAFSYVLLPAAVVQK